MEEDFGSSIWATQTSGTASLSSPFFSTFPQTPPTINQLDDLGGFGTQENAAAQGDDDDEFGDFGEFGHAEGTTEDFADSSHLSVGQIEEILGALWDGDDLSEALTDEDVREVGGLAQILVTPDSRALYESLFQKTPPSAHPPNWTRSRIRRQHLITLGIPVNLDEVLPHAGGKALPTLHISTRPVSAPPVPRNGAQATSGRASLLSVTPAPETSRKGAVSQLGLGPKPQLDEQRIAELLALTPDQLSLLPLTSLETCLSDLRTQTHNTSALLTYLLQTRDALQQDSETYNSLIAELVGEAQKMKTIVGRTNSRRGSGVM
ncbi:hypothetical protein BGW80DRAFT_1284455 [Lactifluus volemus]|nr:hypothetical protein BGW80DRAFT_1284455 [Lactifluus volemus]